MDAPVNHLLTDGLQLVGDRAVVDDVADAEDGAADQAPDRRPAPARARRPRPRQALGQLRRQGVVHRRGGAELHADPAAQAVVLQPRLAANNPQAVEPPVPRHDLEKIQKQRARPARRGRGRGSLISPRARPRREARMASSLGNGRRLRRSGRRAPPSPLRSCPPSPPRPTAPRRRRRRSAPRRRRRRFRPRRGRVGR